jgi:MFS family permease
MASLGVVLGLLSLTFFPPHFFWVIFFILIYGISVFGHQPAMTSLVSRVTPPKFFGIAYGLMFFSTFGIGSISTTIAGYLIDQYNIEVPFLVNNAFAAITLLTSLAIQRRIRED